MNFDYPQQMTDAARWMVRIEPKTDADTKAPQSIYEVEPDGYAGPKPWLRSRWGCPSQWAGFQDAVSYSLENDRVTHLCFVVRDDAFGDRSRWITFDFDNCFDGDLIDPEVAAFLVELNTWVEYSKSGDGLHAVAKYTGPMMRTQYKLPVGGCKVDVITSGQIVTTGNVYENYRTLNENVNLDAIEFLKVKVKTADVDAEDCFDLTPTLPPGKEYLSNVMLDWEYSISGQGGDQVLWRAACHLARHGVTGEAAVELLKLVPAEPAWSEYEIRHKVQDAYRSVCEEREFGAYEYGQLCRKDLLTAVDPTEVEVVESVEPTRGFEGLEIGEHFERFSLASMPAYMIRDVMFEEGALMIGGQNKTFKTSIGMDLLVSLSTLKPFLNKFPIECEAKSVTVFSSETREHLMTQYLTTVLESKGITVDDIHNSFTISSAVPGFRMDQAGRMLRNHAFEKFLAEREPEIVFFDPLYRMFAGVNQADISSMGQALEYVESVCRDNGAMPIICHHSRKPSTVNGVEFPAMTLNDLSGAGGGAFCRQWMLLSHTQAYINGSARLHANIGASGGDTKEYIIELETFHDVGEDRRRVWKPLAFDLNVDQEILHRLKLDGSTTVSKLAKTLRRPEGTIKHAIDKLDKDGKIQLVNNTIRSATPDGEYEF